MLAIRNSNWEYCVTSDLKTEALENLAWIDKELKEMVLVTNGQYQNYELCTSRQRPSVTPKKAQA